MEVDDVTVPLPDAPPLTPSCSDSSSELSSPSESPSDEEYRIDYEAARQRFKDHCHSPPPPDTMAKRPCLKAPSERNP